MTSLHSFLRNRLYLCIALLLVTGSCNEPIAGKADTRMVEASHKGKDMIEAGQSMSAKMLNDSVWHIIQHANKATKRERYEFLSFYYTYGKKDADSNLQFIDSALAQLEDRTEDYEYLFNAMFRKGSALLSKGNNNEAFECFYATKKLAEKYEDTCSFAKLNNNLGLVSFRQRRYNEAISYFRNAFYESAHCGALDFTNAFFLKQSHLDNIGLSFERLASYDSAIQYYQLALAFIKRNEGKYNDHEILNATARAVILGNLGGCYLKQGKDMKAAYAALTESYRLHNLVRYDRKDAQLTALKLAQYHLATGQPAAADALLKTTKTAIDSLHNAECELKWLYTMWIYYDTVKNIPQAYNYHLAYTRKKDSFEAATEHITNTSLSEVFNRLSQQSEISDLRKDNGIKNIYLATEMLFSLMAVVILYLIWRNYRNSRTNVTRLTTLNEQVNELNNFKTRLLAIIAHDLRAPLASLSGMMPMIEDFKPEELTEIKEQITRQLNAVNEMLDNLLRWASTSLTTGETASSSVIDIKDIARKNKELLLAAADIKNIEIADKVIPGTLAAGDEEQINVVIRNLIANAIKFTQPGGRVTIYGKRAGGHTTISVTDTGIGMTEKQINKLFTTEHGRTYGTDGERGVGLGLLLCKEYVDANAGTITVSSTVGKGSTFTIVLPAPPEANM